MPLTAREGLPASRRFIKLRVEVQDKTRSRGKVRIWRLTHSLNSCWLPSVSLSRSSLLSTCEKWPSHENSRWPLSSSLLKNDGHDLSVSKARARLPSTREAWRRFWRARVRLWSDCVWHCFARERVAFFFGLCRACVCVYEVTRLFSIMDTLSPKVKAMIYSTACPSDLSISKVLNEKLWTDCWLFNWTRSH